VDASIPEGQRAAAHIKIGEIRARLGVAPRALDLVGGRR
jgi:hypothetical protein